MNIQEQLATDLKSAMLARDTEKTETLKGIKSAILYEEVAKGKRESGLSEEETIAVFKREAKKRKDAIALYTQGGNNTLAKKEQAELEIILAYLPSMLSEEDTEKLVDEEMRNLGIESPERSDTGRIIGAVKKRGGVGVDPALIAQIVNKKIAG